MAAVLTPKQDQPRADRHAPDKSDDRQLRVLVVEDNADIADLVRRALEADDMTVEHARDLRTARTYLGEKPPDVVVLDVELPDGSGLELLRDPSFSVPMVVLSARQEELDRVLGLELGADDYMIKPFYPRELATRVRRAAGRRPAAPTRIDVGDLVVDLDAREVFVRGQPVALTAREFELLAHLARSPRRVFGRDELLRDVWNSSPEWQTTKTVNEHIRRLRQKLERDPARPSLIVTAGRAGYRLDA